MSRAYRFGSNITVNCPVLNQACLSDYCCKTTIVNDHDCQSQFHVDKDLLLLFLDLDTVPIMFYKGPVTHHPSLTGLHNRLNAANFFFTGKPFFYRNEKNECQTRIGCRPVTWSTSTGSSQKVQDFGANFKITPSPGQSWNKAIISSQNVSSSFIQSIFNPIFENDIDE